MSPVEFAHWRALYQREPFGFDMDNFRMGQIAAAVVNVTRTRRKDMVTAADFYPTPPKRKPPLTERQQQELEKRRHGKRRNSHS